ncbi:MAG: glycosyltransferase [Gemmatimonadaceae bacterium]|nr:glycosyltransferase [Gemmatimonadaceae bacterium]
MRILIVTHAYAPGRNPRAFRWSALAQHWSARGHDVHVLTAPVPGLSAIEQIDGVTVHRTRGHGVETLRARLGSSQSQAAVTSGVGPGKRSARALIRKVLKAAHDLTWKKLYWPDYAALWIVPAIRHGSGLLDGATPTVLISVSIPFSSHVVGFFLRRKPSVSRWVVDIGDPFAFMVEAPTNNHSLYGTLNFAVERRILDSADAISVTTEGTRRRYIATYPGVEEKIREVPPLVNIPAAPHRPSQSSHTPIRLVYTGTLHRTIRGPERLLSLYQKLVEHLGDRIELHLYGNHREVADVFESLPRAVRAGVFLHGEVDREEALGAMRDATVLVNIGNDTTYQLPSKLVEYAAMEKPVLNVVMRPNDSSVAFFKAHRCVFNVIGDADVSDAKAGDAVKFLLDAPDAECSCDREWLRRFSTENVAAGYEQLF